MTWESLVQEKKLQPHRTSREEIGDLLKVADRGRKDAESESISLDLRFAAAYNAALSLTTVALAASGYRTMGTGHHATSFLALPLALRAEAKRLATYLNSCRRKRNVVEYRKVGEVTEVELGQLLTTTGQLREDVLRWLGEHHPTLAP